MSQLGDMLNPLRWMFTSTFDSQQLSIAWIEPDSR